MALIDDEVAAQLKEEFARLVNPVRLAVFSQALADPESEQVRRLVEELAALDSRLTAESLQLRARQGEGGGARHRAHPRHRHPRRGEGLRHPLLRAAPRLRVRHAGGRDPRRLAAGDSGLGPKPRARRWPSWRGRSTSRSSRRRPDRTAPGRSAWPSSSRWRATRSRADGIEVTGFPELARRTESRRCPRRWWATASSSWAPAPRRCC